MVAKIEITKCYMLHVTFVTFPEMPINKGSILETHLSLYTKMLVTFLDLTNLLVTKRLLCSLMFNM